MKAEDYKDMSPEEVQTIFQKRFEQYKEKINNISDIEELKKLELEKDNEQAEFDKYLEAVEYDIPQEPIEFEGKRYTPRDIAKKIIYYINRNEQSFEYCLGLHGIIKLWKTTELEKISYGAYDSTLRLLGQAKYKGDSEWVDILAINNFLTQIRDAYLKDRTMFVALAEERNVIVSRIQLCSKLNETDEQ